MPAARRGYADTSRRAASFACWSATPKKLQSSKNKREIVAENGSPLFI
jgi:hypothetical protein